ncbi:MAG: hypothetical protein Q7S75_01265, partial [bacterium]|nr:hypothetical protein [bacterium]
AEMPEADAEGDTPLGWATSKDRMHEAQFCIWILGQTAHLLVFEPFAGLPPPRRPFNFQKPPRKDVHGGECGGAGGHETESCHRVQNHHARGARELVGVSAKIGTSEFIQTSQLV